MLSLQDLVERLQEGELLENALSRWAVALAVAAGVALALWVLKRLLRRRADRLAECRPSEWFMAAADLVRVTRSWFLLVLALYCGSLLLVLPVRFAAVAVSAAIIALLVQAALWGDALVRSLVLQKVRQRGDGDGSAATTLAALGFVGRVAIWTIMLLLILANLGINVTAMVAGLGIGGIAVALAAQNVLSDLFASASIVLDKPFVLGDFIVVGEDRGTVDHIGLKTTRVRSLSGEQLIFSNAELLKSRIRNFKRMAERRALFTIGVTYQTPPETVAAIPGMLREAVEAESPTRFDRAHFQRYGDFALVFEVVYFVLVADYNTFMDIQQSINLTIMRRFAEAGIEFAYPTQTVLVHHLADDA